MQFPRIQFLDWIRENVSTVEYDLANAAMPPLSWADLDMDPKSVVLSPRRHDAEEALVDLLAKTYGVSSKNVLVTHGGSHAIFLALAGLLEPSERVLLETPNYEPFYRIAQWIGAEVKMLQRRWEDHWQVSLEELQRHMSKHVRAVILTNLHNPSGVVTHPEKVQAIAQIARSYGAQVISGEVFLDAALNGPYPPAFKFGDNCISLGSLSKVYGLDGLRVGWVLAAEKTLDRLQRVIQYTTSENAGATQQVAAVALRKRPEILARTQARVRQNLEALQVWLKSQKDLEMVPPDGGTVCFPHVKHNIDTLAFSNHLKKQHSTLVVPGEFFWAQGFLRLSLAPEPAVFKEGLSRLGAGLAGFRKVV